LPPALRLATAMGTNCATAQIAYIYEGVGHLFGALSFCPCFPQLTARLAANAGVD
jgi:hypothetical protein